MKTECKHDWQEKKGWSGDESVVGGTQVYTYWVCRKCGEETTENKEEAEQ